jgi:hypothetical protein
LLPGSAHGALSLAQLQSVGGRLAIEDTSDPLTVALPVLASAGGELSITSNGRDPEHPGLTSFDLAKLAAIGGPITITDNASLLEADLGYATSVPTGDVRIERNALLERTYLFRVASVAGSVVVADDPALTALLGGDELTTVGGDIALANLPLLAQLGSFTALAEVGGNIELTGLGKLEQIRNWDGLESLDGHLWIRGNAGLEDISAFPHLVSIGHGLSIDDNPALAGLTGFLQLESVGALGIPGVDADLTFIGDTQLTNTAFNPVGAQQFCVPRGQVDQKEDAFDSIETLGGLRFSGDDALAALPQMPCLTAIAGDLRIEGNSGLLVAQDSSLAVKTIGGTLSFESNPLVTSLAGLLDIESVGADFSVVDNVTLPTAEATALRDAIGVADIGGTVTISGNAP